MANVKKHLHEGMYIIDITRWPDVDPSGFSEDEKEKYNQRKAAVIGYFSETPLNDVVKSVGLSRQFITKLVKKCLKDHPDGRIWGFRALVANVRTNEIKYTRIEEVKKKSNKRGGFAGALGKLFERFPDIRDDLEAIFLKKSDKIIAHESKIPLKSIHKLFIGACRAHNLTNEYPFNVKDLGRIALLRYFQNLLKRRYSEAVVARFGDIAARNAKTGGAEEPRMPIDKPYVGVEFDGHHFDIDFILEIPARGGGFIEVVVNRFWILAIRECMSGAVLSYQLAFGHQYTKYDVMQCIKKAVIPWKRKELTLPGLTYHEQGGMPSEVIKELEWAIHEEFSYDSAKANIAHEVKRIIKETIGSTPNNGPLAFPEYRPMVESLFKLLEENGFHRLPSTLGSNPKDTRRNKPEQQAINFKIRLEHLEELTAVLVSNFNGCPTARLGYRSPLEYLNFYATQEDVFIPKLEESKREKLYMFNERFVKKVRGSMKHGKRPYVHLLMADYTSPILADSYELIGKELTIYVDPDDPRFCLAFLPDGTELGILTAKGYWGCTPHTIEIRRETLKAKRKQLIHYTENDDPIHAYMEHINEQAKTSQRARKTAIKLDKASKNNKNGDSTPPITGHETDTPQKPIKESSNNTIEKKTYLL